MTAYTIDALWDRYVNTRRNSTRPLTTYSRTQREAFNAGVQHYRELLNGWDDLTDNEALEELRAGENSLYWPAFGGDPRIWVDCPTCHKRVLISAEGYCEHCGEGFD